MLTVKIKDVEFKDLGSTVYDSNAILVIPADKAFDAMEQALIDVAGTFEIDGVEYTDYKVLAAIKKGYNYSEEIPAFYEITLKCEKEAVEILTGKVVTVAQAQIMRKEIEYMASSVEDPGDDMAWAFPDWKVGVAYKVGDKVAYVGLLYKCVQAHTSQADWTPDAAVSLWARTSDPTIEWPDWFQPTGAQDAYAKGDKVSHNDKHWISDVDANVWEPGVYGWTQQ